MQGEVQLVAGERDEAEATMGRKRGNYRTKRGKDQIAEEATLYGD